MKTTNPIFGSLIIVWLIHNWKLMYKIFNFSSTETIEQRMAFIASYLDPPNFLPNLGWCILIAFVVLMVSYFLLYLSRLIINFFENIVAPFVYKITDKSSVVLKTNYELLKTEKDQLNDRLESERKSRVSLQNELENLESKYSKLQIDFDTYKANGIKANLDATTPAPSKSEDTEHPLNQETNELHQVIAELQKKVVSYEATKPNIQLAEDQKKILTAIAQHGKMNMLQIAPGVNKVKAEYNLDELRRRNLITGNAHEIILTENGRKYLIENNLIN
jgi:hypothetical protein